VNINPALSYWGDAHVMRENSGPVVTVMVAKSGDPTPDGAAPIPDSSPPPRQTQTIPVSGIGHKQLATLYRYWHGKLQGRDMPLRADIDPTEIPGAIWPHTMILEVVRQDGALRFRYRRVGEVFWRALGREPTGKFVDEVLPDTAGYRDYVVGIYREMVERRRPMYTENCFTLHGQSVPMWHKRVSLPLSGDGGSVGTILAGHVFEYPRDDDHAFPQVNGLQEGIRAVIE
jgi:hypothetical protein